MACKCMGKRQAEELGLVLATAARFRQGDDDARRRPSRARGERRKAGSAAVAHPEALGKQIGDEERWSTTRASVAEVDDAVLGKKTKTTSGKKRTSALCLLLGLQLRRGGDEIGRAHV